MSRLFRIASPSTLALALIMLVLPFLSVSCDVPGGFGRVAQGGTTSYTGVDLLVGSDPSVTSENLRPAADVEDDNIGIEPGVVVGTIVMLAGLALAFMPRYRLAAGAALAGWVLMLIGLLGARRSLSDRLEMQLVTPLPDGKTAGAYVAIGPGFWLMTLLLVASAGSSLLATRADRPSVNRPGNGE